MGFERTTLRDLVGCSVIPRIYLIQKLGDKTHFLGTVKVSTIVQFRIRYDRRLKALKMHLYRVSPDLR